MKKTLLFLVGLMIIIPTTVKANYLLSYHNYGVTSEEEKLILEEEEERSVFDEVYYRLVLKDTRDAVDYVILGTIIFLMLVTIILSNKKSYVLPGNTSVFLEDTSPSVDVRDIALEGSESSVNQPSEDLTKTNEEMVEKTDEKVEKDK